MKWDLADLASTADIADECGVGMAAVANWATRHPDFPRPLVVVARGKTPIYSRKAVQDWQRRRSS